MSTTRTARLNLIEQFTEASKRWPNLSSVLVTWPENAEVFDTALLSEHLKGQYCVPVPAPEGWMLAVATPLGESPDAPTRRYRNGEAGTMILSRSFGVFSGKRIIRDPDEVAAFTARWKTLATEAAQLPMCRELPAPYNDIMRGAPVRWWTLFIHAKRGHPTRTINNIYGISVIDDVFLVSANVLAMLDELGPPAGNAATDSGPRFTPAPTDWLTGKQVADITGLSQGEVTRKCDSGELLDNGQKHRARRIDPASVAKLEQRLHAEGRVKIVPSSNAKTPMVRKLAPNLRKP